jgi:hypothetical protein
MNLALEFHETDATDHARRDEIEARYWGAVGTFVDDLVADRRTASAAMRAVNDDFDEISALSSVELHSTYDKIRYDLINRIEDEAGPPAWQGTAQKRLVGIGGVALVILLAGGYFALRQYNLTPVTAPIETRAGLEQRADALAKVLHYESWASGRRGMIKNILLWPFEPIPEEVEGARELSGLALGGAAKLVQAGEACGIQFGSGDQALTPQEQGVLEKVSGHLHDKSAQWRDPPILTVLDPIRSSYPCSARGASAQR